MSQPRKRQPIVNPDLQRVLDDIQGKKPTSRPADIGAPGTLERDASRAANQQHGKDNLFRGVGNRHPYSPSNAERSASDSALRKKPAGKPVNPFPAGTIEGDATGAAGQSYLGDPANAFREVGRRHPYNPNPAQRDVFSNTQGSNNSIEIPQPLEKQPKLPAQPTRKLGELHKIPGTNFGLDLDGGQAEDEKVRNMSLEDKLIKAMRLSIASGQLSKQTQAELLKILNPNNLPALGLLLGVWGAGHLIGAGQVVDAFMLGFMLGTLGAKGVEALGHLWSFFSGAQNATTQSELKLASEEFASFVSIVTTEGLTAFVGAKGAQALKGLQGHVSSAFPKFKGLSPEQQKSVVEALDASRRTASKVGGKFAQVATEAKNWLDVALGKRKAATASNSGSKGDGVYQQSGNGQGRGQSVAAQHPWREQLIKDIKKNEWKTEKNVVGLVEDSIKVLEDLRSFPVTNSKGKIVKVPFGSQGTNLAVQRLNNLAIDKILPLRQDIVNLIKKLDSPSTQVNGEPLLKSISEYRILERSINAIDDHLRPDDLIGALRDNLGVPVIIGDRTFKHITEANEAINSLGNAQRVLNHFLQKTRTPNLYEVGKHGQSFEKSAIEIQKSIGQIMKQIEVIERDYKGFVDLKSYYQGYSISINAPFLNRSIRYQYHNPDLTIALQIARSSSIGNESLNEFVKTLAEAKKNLQPADSMAETKNAAAQENIVVDSPKVKKSRGFEMG